MAALEKDHRTATLGDPDRAMVDYVDKLTRTPSAMTAEDVESLRRAGFGDAAILGICQIAAYWSYVNRLADGLGIELES